MKRQRRPTELGQWALQPRPMTPAQVADLIARTREAEILDDRVHHALAVRKRKSDDAAYHRAAAVEQARAVRR